MIHLQLVFVVSSYQLYLTRFYLIENDINFIGQVNGISIGIFSGVDGQ